MKNIKVGKTTLLISFLFVFCLTVPKVGNAAKLDYGNIQHQVKLYKYLDTLVAEKSELVKSIKQLEGLSITDFKRGNLDGQIRQKFAEWIEYEYHLLKIINFYLYDSKNMITNYNKNIPLFRLKILFKKAKQYFDNFPIKEYETYYPLSAKNNSKIILLPFRQLETVLGKSKITFSHINQLYNQTMQDIYYAKLTGGYERYSPHIFMNISYRFSGVIGAAIGGVLQITVSVMDFIIPDKIWNTNNIEKGVQDIYFQMAHVPTDLEKAIYMDDGYDFRINFAE